jgi:DNA-binding PadR family transcriptional regulator
MGALGTHPDPDVRRRLLDALGEKPLSGHEVVQRLARDAQGAAAAPGAAAAAGGAGEASIYPALHRLEADGKLRAAWERTQSGPVRRRYSVARRP